MLYINRCTVMDVAGAGIILSESVGLAGMIFYNVMADIGGDGIVVGSGAQFVIVTANIIARCEKGLYVVADQATTEGNAV